jgi:hypothetical protein
VSEDVFFGNPNFNTNGHNQKILLPLLDYLSFEDQQSARANRRLDVAYGADDVFAWFLPGKGGDHDLKFGLNYLFSSLRVQDWSNMNGTFIFNTDLPFDRNNPRTYPERFSIRVPDPLDFYMKGHFIGMFAQDKWKLGNDLTLSLGTRYDLEILKTPNQDNPMFAGNPEGYPQDRNNISPRVGFSWAMDDAGRSAMRGGFGLFYQRTSYTFLTNMFGSQARFSNSFTVNFPTNNVDPGPRAGAFPTNPMLVSGPTVTHDVIDAMFPPGTRIRNAGTVRFDNPDRELAWARQYSIGYERQIGSAIGLSVDPLIGVPGDWLASVTSLVNAGWIDYNTIQVSGTKRLSDGWQARLSYAYSRGRGNTPTGQGDQADSQFLDDLNLDNEVGPTNVDRPHILTVSGSYDVPRTGGLKVSAVYSARSGTPFSLRDTTFDLDRNGFTNNEYLPAGSYTAIGQTDFAYPVDYKGGRNGARGPNYQRLDFRAGYRFRLGGGRTLDAFLDLFNATNEPNFANPVGDRRLAATFLRLTSTIDESPTRTAQLNLRYGF